MLPRGLMFLGMFLAFFVSLDLQAQTFSCQLETIPRGSKPKPKLEEGVPPPELQMVKVEVISMGTNSVKLKAPEVAEIKDGLVMNLARGFRDGETNEKWYTAVPKDKDWMLIFQLATFSGKTRAAQLHYLPPVNYSNIKEAKGVALERYTYQGLCDPGK